MARRITRARGPIDQVLLVLVSCAVVFGVLVVFDVLYGNSPSSKEAGGIFGARKHALLTVAGFVAMLVMSHRPCWKIERIAPWFFGLCVVLLWLVVRFGKVVHGAKRWLEIGHFTFQPSEFAKLALVIALAVVLSRQASRVRDLRDWPLWGSLLLLGAVLLPMVFQKDLGTMLVMGLTGITMLFLAGASLKHLASVVGASGAVVTLMIAIEPFRRHRIVTWLNPWSDMLHEGYQVVHGLTAMVTGRYTGLGFCNSHEKFILPAAHTDYVLAPIGEEIGMLGAIALMCLLLAIGVRGLWIANQAPDRQSRLLGSGIASGLIWQVLVNVAVATNSIPATGVPLPFISFGGTSMILNLAGMGILLGISRTVGAADRGTAAAEPPPAGASPARQMTLDW